ncbi:hypothetical protein M422DRAFT_271988 [Sphaerobolus stellatus SS14]|uniref:Uncharacterized protein n=1 Tax=Sphaerobolus stellatus (strain SS14) TaxID=990650 RepID=A0A0C9UNQ0_SPHS4|nr:hypothetical protein M422DRAFT_271988 [Sphaerobolus stellatus SS14]
MSRSNGGRGHTTAAASAGAPRIRVSRALAGVLAYVYGDSNAGGTLGVPDVCLRWFQRTWETYGCGASVQNLRHTDLAGIVAYVYGGSNAGDTLTSVAHPTRPPHIRAP